MRDIEKIKTVWDLADIKRTIDEIDRILNAWFFDANEARKKIYEINEKHQDNLIAYEILRNMNNRKRTSSVPISIAEASDTGLKNDLMWKRDYLQGKAMGKTLDEIIKEFGR